MKKSHFVILFYVPEQNKKKEILVLYCRFDFWYFGDLFIMKKENLGTLLWKTDPWLDINLFFNSVEDRNKIDL